MNKVILTGRMTRNPETRFSQSATPLAIARCGIAVNRQRAKEGEQNVDFFNIVAFGKIGEFMEKYGSKGRLVEVVGRMQTNTWEDAQKVKRTSYDVIVEEFTFLDKKGSTEPGAEAGAETGTGAGAGTGERKPGEFAYDEEDDLPF